ncbi:MAG: branched-chain amino acid ABC transporter permease [Thermoanaerobacterales bacterium]|jgi:neutral amino acid transport system permease protein|nr:branched-chain amino acid ABC transporter permease [Thermoanaerobacterales bacterium]
MSRLLRGAVAGIGLLVVVGTLLWASPAGAQEPGADDPAEQEPGQSQQVSGTLRYKDDSGEDVFVEGLEVTVESADGSFSETVTSDEDGRWAVEVPGPGRYTASIDPDQLPEDVSLRDEDRSALTVTLAEGESRAVLFALQSGEGGRGGSHFFDRAARLSVEGLKFGLIIAICAIGLSLIFGTTGLVNFAHGEMVTWGALVAFFFNVTLGWPMVLSAAIAVVVGAITGLGIDRGLWRPLERRGTGLIAMLVITIGVGILIRYVFLYQFGGFTRTYADYQLQTEGLELGPVTIVPRDLATILISLGVLVAVALALQLTRIGKAMRAVADNRDLAESSGIDVERVVGYVWAAGAGLAALGGVLLGLAEQVDWLMGFRLLLLMFAGVILGGIGTAYGALIGSIVIGLLVQLSTLWVAPELKNVVALLVLIIILIVRPQGILGQAERVG